MPTLVERTREVTSTESDDFFQDDTILFYLNKTQERIVSSLIQIEDNSEKSLRALDPLRKHLDIGVNGLTFTDEGDYFTAGVEFPSTDPINQFMFLKYDQSGVMRELTYNERVQLEWGNLRPSDSEVYYMVTRDSTDTLVFQIFTQSDDSTTNKNVRIYYILDPTDIALADNSMSELPSRLENALIYGAAKMLVSQESINDQVSQQGVELFQQQHQEELQANAY